MDLIHAIWTAVLGLWAVISLIIITHYWREAGEQRHLARTHKTNARLYLDKWLEEHKKIHSLEIEANNAKLMLEVEQKNMATAEEHLKYYMECAADLERLVEMKDQELNERDHFGYADHQKHLRDVLIDKCRQLESAQAELEKTNNLLAELRQDYDDYREFTELRCSEPGPFSQGGGHYDPKQQNEAPEDPRVPLMPAPPARVEPKPAG